MIVTVASGKGGVGKSTLAASLAVLMARDYEFQLIDADVDCPDLHLLFPGREEMRKPVSIGKIAEINFNKCNSCMICHKKCPFNAISEKLEIDPYLCEGCGYCQYVCPQNAITMTSTITGEIIKKRVYLTFDGKRLIFPFTYGQLNPGKSSSGKLVDEIKKFADNKSLTLVDSAAGVGCPVISSIKDSDLILAIAEPTPAASSDLARLLELAGHFGVEVVAILNKADMSGRGRDMVISMLNDEGIDLIGEIPYHISAFEALAAGKPLIMTDTPLKENIYDIFNRLRDSYLSKSE